MPLDTDIAAATTAFELDKIKAQDYRNSLASQKADRAAQLAVVQGFYSWAQAEFAVLPAEEDHAVRYRRNMALAIAANYMKPNSATVDEVSMQNDANLDAKKLKMAVDAATQA